MEKMFVSDSRQRFNKADTCEISATRTYLYFTKSVDILR